MAGTFLVAVLLQQQTVCAQSPFEEAITAPITPLTANLANASGPTDQLGGTSLPPVEDPILDGWFLQVLPAGLLWHSFAAAPKEPRFATVFLHDANGGWYWDSTLGGRVGLLRYGTFGARHPSGWQLDLEGAAMPRLDMLHAQDLESVDFRIGTQLTAAEGPWSFKFGYFHLSSHIGDEYQVRIGSLDRVNYVTESVVSALSLQATEELRTYGEVAYAFHRDGGAGRWQVQTGFEYTLLPPDRLAGTPFIAANLDLRESVDFDPALNVLSGWQWKGLESGHTLRVGLQVLSGQVVPVRVLPPSRQSAGPGNLVGLLRRNPPTVVMSWGRRRER